MKIIKHPDTFQCEICGTQYSTAYKAQVCENSQTLEVPQYKIGDNIIVRGKYGFHDLKIVNIKLSPSIHSSILHKDVYDDIHILKARLKKYNIGEFQTHEYEFYVNEEFEIARDSYTNVVNYCDIVIDI